MTRGRLATLMAGFAVMAAALPAVAQTQTQTRTTPRSVGAGLPPSVAKAFMRQLGGADVNAFFPSNITVRVGSTVVFRPNAFHTVDLPPRGQGDLALITPTGRTVSGAKDAAAAPFWFNGRPLLGFNPALQSRWGMSATYNGSSRVESGLPTASKPAPFRVRFTSTGTFKYFCDVHRNMQGTVHVVGSGAAVPSARVVARATAQQIAADKKTAQSLLHPAVPPKTVHVGQAGANGVEIFALLPARLQVPVGTTVTFTMTPGSREVHTATAGPGPATRPSTYLGRLATSFTSPVPSPIGLYPSQPPGNDAGLTTASHGNGFWNSGGLDEDPGTPQPVANAVKFTKAGTYNFYCLVHPFMHGVVVVR
jgi:plastocyanin